jgi:hypothetical protein
MILETMRDHFVHVVTVDKDVAEGFDDLSDEMII